MAILPGSIRQRGRYSWQIRYEAGPPDEFGTRRQYSETVRGSKRDAITLLVNRVAEKNAAIAQGETAPARPIGRPARDALPIPSTTQLPAVPPQTIGEYMSEWLSTAGDFSAKTLERYTELSTRQIEPFLGGVLLHQLSPKAVEHWHLDLLRRGSHHGHPLHARTVRHAHRLLSRAYARAVVLELVPRNVVALVKPPRIPDSGMQILAAHQIGELLQRLRQSNSTTKRRLFPSVAAALGTGLRRGELLAARWNDLDLNAQLWRVDRSLQQTRAGLAFKPPKTKVGRRTLSIGAELTAILQEHKRVRMAHQFMFGLGRLTGEDLVFATALGGPLAPDTVSRDWANSIRDFPSLPPVSLHSLRHTYASGLIAGGMNIVDVSYQLGHASPAVTMSIYAHLFDNRGGKQAAAIADRMLHGWGDGNASHQAPAR